MKTSISQAANNAFADWFASVLTDVVVEPRWPAPNKKLPEKSITLITAGPRIDQPFDLRLLSNTSQGPTQTKANWQLAACTQPVQLDVWALSDVDRDDIVARIDDLLLTGEGSLDPSYQPAGVYPMPVGQSNLIAVKDGWEQFGTIADFDFESPNFITTHDSAEMSIYRASFRGNAYFMLTATSVGPRQLVINFQQFLS